MHYYTQNLPSSWKLMYAEMYSLHWIRVNESFLFNATWTIFQQYHGERTNVYLYIWWKDDGISFSWIFIVLDQWHKCIGKHVSTQGHIILIPTNLSLLFQINAEYLAENQQIPLFDQIEPLMHDIPTRGGEHTSHYITDAVTELDISVLISILYCW